MYRLCPYSGKNRITPYTMTFLSLTLLAILAVISFMALPQAADADIALNVEGCNSLNTCGPAGITYRWLLEVDNTNQKAPGIRVPDSIGLDIHNSHAPVVCTGTAATINAANCPAYNPATPYYISVLPNSGYSIGGSQIAAGQASVTVKVHQHPLPTAQISVLVFKDHSPINNIPDAGEPGIGGSEVLLFDIFGQMSVDAFGNPLGTLYTNNDPNQPVAGSAGLRTCTQAEVDAYAAAVANPLANLTEIKKCTVVGELFIKNLVPGKYGVRTVPYCGTTACNAATYVQTSTIEGTPGIDAWVQANEAPKFIEGFGTGFYHAFIGFVFPAELTWGTGAPGTYNVTGVNRFNHFGRPPFNQGFFAGAPVPQCWVGLNDLAAPAGKGLMAVPCGEDGVFALSGVPNGTYQLVTWDKPLDALFGFNTITVNGADLNLGNVLSFRWFGTLQGSIFWDANENGFRDAGESGLVNRTVNIRFRDGSMYQTTVTDIDGFYSFAEVFPFFKWLVAEVDYASHKPTGMTAVSDDGGAVLPHQQQSPPFPTSPLFISTYPSFNALTPQPQHDPATWLFGTPRPTTPLLNPNTGNNLSRTETGPVLLEGLMLFLNQTNVIDWGKYNFAATENGGITGIVFYGTTRAENDPRNSVGETWEPGVPRVQVVLYQDANDDSVIDDINNVPGIQLADVDNYPFGWADGTAAKGTEDVVRCGDGITFCTGDALRVAWTDSFDDNRPGGCIQPLPNIPGVQPCYDNYSTWNQVRPALFDGGYAFGFAAGDTIPSNMTYIVETVPPPGYEIQKEEDKNVDFGDAYAPSPLLLPPPCVGTAANGLPAHVVPAYLSLFPGMQIPAPSAGLTTPLCSMKKVFVAQGQNAASDFSIFTFVPKAARAVGFVNNDLSAEFKADSPIFGEKASPAWLPVSFQDWQGREVYHTYTDEFGSYNALLPSTFTINPPMPTGVSPNILTAVLNYPFCNPNSASPYCDRVGTSDVGIDRNYNPNFSVTPWTLDYWPGKTTYLDTPIVPIASFAGFPINGPDVEPQDGTPVLFSVINSSLAGGGPVLCNNGESVVITSFGNTIVPNPAFDPAIPGSPKEITRDYGFGSVQGTVTVNGASVNPLVTSWTNSSITLTFPDKTAISTGQLMVVRGDNGRTSEMGITLHRPVPDCAGVKYVPGNYDTIQLAIDSAATDALIIVRPGIYLENVFLYKKVTLQGTGAGSTVIYANPVGAAGLPSWHAKAVDLLCTDPFVGNEAPGIMVLGNVNAKVGTACTGATFEDPLRIDGFKIFGAISGGGIYVNTDVSGLKITNNRISGNQGQLGGGIAVGVPTAGPVNNNPDLLIAYNQIVKNGGIQGGGGITLYDGATNYIVRDNLIAGNFSRFYGGGIAHWGLSDNGLIEKNRVLFNEVAFGFNAFGDGGGIFVGSQAPALLAALGEGTGTVTINANLIQGNMAGVGSGAGIRALYVNGVDTGNPDPATWFKLNIFNNIIVNNVAGYYGAGIALQDVAAGSIINNTIANNISTATAANAFQAGSADSTPQPAGIVSNVHSTALAANVAPQTFSDPALVNNIIWDNSSYYTTNGGAGGLILNPAQPVWDLQVLGIPGSMNPLSCLLSDTTGYDVSNITGDPDFIRGYTNTLFSAAVIDEGGNFITVRFMPVSPTAGDYHIKPLSPAVDQGTSASPFSLFPAYLGLDYDGNGRPQGTAVDIGADEYSVANLTLLSARIGTYSSVNNQWYFDGNYNGTLDGCIIDTCINFGSLPQDIPLVGDWTGGGTTKIGIYRVTNGQGFWYLDGGTYNFNTATQAGPFGGWSTDVPVVGDWNGDGRAKIGIYRVVMANSFWYLDNNGNGLFDGCATDLCYGPFSALPGDVPVVGDWTGNGLTKIGVYRFENRPLNPGGYWYLGTAAGNLDMTPASALGPFGDVGHVPVTGDWNGSGTDKIGVYRLINNQADWFLDNGDGQFTSCAGFPGNDLCLGPFDGANQARPVVGK